MEKVRIDDVDRRVMPAADMRPLTDALGATGVAINYYELDPGDSFAFAYHAHEIQEEIFYVQSGAVTFETGDGPVEVEAGEVIRFPPGEYQRGVNEGDERVVALAIGAPLEYGEIEKRRECETCGERTPQTIERPNETVAITRCRICGDETGRFA